MQNEPTILNLSSSLSVDTFKKRLTKAQKRNPVLVRVIITAPLGLAHSEETVLELITAARAKITAVSVVMIVGDCDPFTLKLAKLFDHVQMHHAANYIDQGDTASAQECLYLGFVNEVWGSAV